MVRFKNRYLVFELIWKDGKRDESLGESALLNAFRELVAQNFGDHGLGQALASLQVKYYNPFTGVCVIRCSRDQAREVWVALSMLTDLRNRTAMLHFLAITGTVQNCKRAAQSFTSKAYPSLKIKEKHKSAFAQAEARLKTMEI
ncbi:hypothetical protein WJX74_008434 [Apatococcus lobatus]|uniref:Uncharacterized protein n=1 Tax=Apatococcus lobatus TaxID=904363 RepID=A0AAW1RJ88_9CHLO